MWLLATSGSASIAVVGAAVQGEGGVAGFDAVFLGLALAGFVYASTGAILAIRRPGNLIGAVMLTVGLLIAATFNGYGWGARLTAAHGVHDALAGFLCLAGALGIGPVILGAGPLLALLFPDGRMPWRWLRRGAVAIAAPLTVVLVASALQPGPIGASLADNPIGIDHPAIRALSGVGNAIFGVVVLAALTLAVAGVVARFRRSRGIERQQLKWFVAANFLVALGVGASVADGATSPTLFDRLAPISMSLPPMAVAIAILRYRLYEIDRIVSRTIGWAVVTGVIIGVFALGVVVLQALFAGVTQGDTVAVAASTLAAFALFQPLRRRIQAAVDRRFDRARIDGQRTLADFSDDLRGSIALDAVTGALEGAMTTLRPTRVGVWLKYRTVEQ